MTEISSVSSDYANSYLVVCLNLVLFYFEDSFYNQLSFEVLLVA